jgi:tetratricopeptide (TPR) repeat protein
MEDVGRFKKAEQLFTRTLDLDIAVHGKTYSGVAGSLNAVARVLRKQGRFNGSTDAYRRAVKILEEVSPANDLILAHRRWSLALTLEIQEHSRPANDLLKKSLAVLREAPREKKLKNDSSFVERGESKFRAGEFVEAESLFWSAKGACTKAVGPDHSSTLKMLKNVSRAVRTQGR